MSRVTAVVGLGAMGRHHARLLADLPGSHLLATCDTDASRAAEHAQLRGCQPCSDAAALPDEVEAVVVATPTSAHRQVAEPLLRRGVSCLIEKPLAASLEDADALLAAAEAGGATLMVGHAERFNPGLLRVREQVRDPAFVEAHRLGVFPERSLDVDVVLDLMIHDLDLLAWLTDSDPVDVEAIGVQVLTPKVDIANARITFASGCTANLTASRVSAEMTRKLRAFREDCYVSVDFRAQAAEVFSLQPGEPRPSVERRQFGPASEEELQEPLRLELEAFLAAVSGQQPCACTGEDGRRALVAALNVLSAMERQREARQELRAARGRQPGPSGGA